NRQAVITLLDLLSCDNETVRTDAAAALTNLTGQANGLDLDKWGKWWELHKDQTEARWLAERLAYQSARSMRLGNDLERARAQIVRLHQQLYARLPPTERFAHIQAATDSEDAVVRGLAVAWSVELLPNADALRLPPLTDVLLRLSQDGSLDVQRAAVLALGSTADARAVDRLRTLLSQGSVPVRAAAARALAQQVRNTTAEPETLRKQVVPLLQKALDDPA